MSWYVPSVGSCGRRKIETKDFPGIINMSDTGVNSPTNYEATSWSSPGNVYVADLAYAYCAGIGVDLINDLYALSGVSLYSLIATGAIIKGIEVDVLGNAAGELMLNGDHVDMTVALSVDAGANWSATKSNRWNVGDGDVTNIYGGSADLWGLSGLTKNSFADAVFQTKMDVTQITGGATAINVDWINVTIYYDNAVFASPLQFRVGVSK
jgi:hypothetical protein